MMKIKIRKEILIGIIVLAAGAVAIGTIAWYAKFSERTKLAKDIVSLEPRKEGPPATIEGLREAIGRYEKQIEALVEVSARTGTYWKILAFRLRDKGLHTEAVEALERAISYQPGEAALHYQLGLSAAILGKAAHDYPGGTQSASTRSRDQYYALAEDAYLTAISLSPGYERPEYALAVLYAFEMNRPADAIPHIEKFLDTSRNDTEGLFVLARCYIMTGALSEAVRVYDQIIATAKDKALVADARRNRDYIIGLE